MATLDGLPATTADGVRVVGVSALRDGVNYMLLEPIKLQHVFRNPLEKLPTALFLVGSATFVAVVLQNYSLGEMSQSVKDMMASIRALLFDRGRPRPPAHPAVDRGAIDPAGTRGATSIPSPPAEGADVAARGGGVTRQEVAALPGGAATVSDVYATDTYDESRRRGSPDSWTIVSPVPVDTGTGDISPVDSVGSATDAGQALSAQLNAIMQRTAQRATGDPAVLHPATVGHSKRENWSDAGDAREAAFDQADTHPVFAGAEWCKGSGGGGGYQPAVRHDVADGRPEDELTFET